VARDLLAQSGSIFVQIGDENVHLVRALLDEVFGREAFLSQISFRTTTVQAGDFLPGTNDYVLWYGKTPSDTKFRRSYQSRSGTGWVNYDFLRLSSGEHRRMSTEERNVSAAMPPDAIPYRRSPLTSNRPPGSF